MKNEIIIFEDEEIKLEVNIHDETVWLASNQLVELFKSTYRNIRLHINNIYNEGELRESSTMKELYIVQSEGNREIRRKVKYYNLDMIISIGYRVNSKRGIKFRQWAATILKQYLIEGYVINQKRLDYLEKTVKLIEIANRNECLVNDEAKVILSTIVHYSKALNLLDQYDYKTLNKPKGIKNTRKITCEKCIMIIKELKFNEKSTLFALERKHGIDSIINNIYQTFDESDVYQSVQEKCANFLYLCVKNHVFIDGNKRIERLYLSIFSNFITY